MSETKVCRKCGETKVLAEFHRLKKSADGLDPSCKACMHARYVKERERRLAYRGKWYSEKKGEVCARQQRYYRTGTNDVRYIWGALIKRCADPKNAKFADYGGRGIRVAPEWLGDEGFERFLSHIGPRPSDDYSVDRIDVNGHYEPGNVRWATQKQQMRNTRSNRLLTFNGKTQPVVAWAEELGIPGQTISQRINRLGWSVEEALTRKSGDWRVAGRKQRPA